jgi:hypothetical protein
MFNVYLTVSEKDCGLCGLQDEAEETVQLRAFRMIGCKPRGMTFKDTVLKYPSLQYPE